MSQCRLCEKEGKLVKAHVIPEAFFRVLREDGNSPQLLTSTPDHLPKPSHIGVYDKGILCAACESKFDRFDDYGIQTLLVRFGELFRYVTQHGNVVAYEAENVDQSLLLRFLVATLWRASVSTHSFYGRVRLGTFESVARQVILEPEAPVPTIFAACLSRWKFEEENRQVARVLLSPFRERLSGINAYRLYLGEAVAYIKVDSQPLPNPFRNYALLARPHLTAIARGLEESKDYASMVHTVRQSDLSVQRVRAGHRPC